MSIATLYMNNSDARYLEKSLTKIADVPIILKDNTSIATPEIILSNNNFDSRCNYIFIDIFNRYYTITNTTYSQQRYILSLKRDSKTSFINQLKNCDCIANRSSNKYNSYINDNRYSALQYSNPVLKKFDGSFNKKLSYILTIAGGA